MMMRGMSDMAKKSRYIAYVKAVRKAEKEPKDGKRRQTKAADRPAD